MCRMPLDTMGSAVTCVEHEDDLWGIVGNLILHAQSGTESPPPSLQAKAPLPSPTCKNLGVRLSGMQVTLVALL